MCPVKYEAIRNILVPVDFSKPSKEAAVYALSLAKHLKAKLRLVHAIDLNSYALYGDPTSTPYVETTTSDLDIAKKSMDALVRELGDQSISTGHNVVTTESMTDFIESECKQFDIDLIVMSTHGRTGFTDFVIGSVAKLVVRKAPCPVLTLTPQAIERQASVSIRKVLHPTDFSDASMLAAKYASGICEDFNAALHIGHFVDYTHLAFLHSHRMWDNQSLTEEIQKTVKDRLDSYAKKLESSKSMESNTVIYEGHTGDGICKTAKEEDTDLIVMATNGRGGIKRLVLGSVAERVLATSPCPVITLNSHLLAK